MENFFLRKANQQDARIIRKMVISANLNPSGLRWQRFWVAVDGTEGVIGCVQRKPHRDGSVELASLVVVEDWRGKGVARALIEAVIESHHGLLYLMCRSGLGDFYKRFGFVVPELEAMPRYLQRISKLADNFQRLTSRREGLLVMGRECYNSQVDLNPLSST